MRSMTEGAVSDQLSSCFLPLRRLRRHLPLAGEDKGLHD
jgi:hypothetical protein